MSHKHARVVPAFDLSFTDIAFFYFMSNLHAVPCLTSFILLKGRVLYRLFYWFLIHFQWGGLDRFLTYQLSMNVKCNVPNVVNKLKYIEMLLLQLKVSKVSNTCNSCNYLQFRRTLWGCFFSSGHVPLTSRHRFQRVADWASTLRP